LFVLVVLLHSDSSTTWPVRLLIPVDRFLGH